MKILLVNFLRLGDIIMMAPLINDIKRRYPSAEIHQLIFGEFSIVRQVIGQVDQWHLMPRTLIQETAASSESGLLDAPDLILSLFDELNSLNFDLAINMSHTAFSALGMSLISAREKWGTYFEGDQLLYSSKSFEEVDLGEVKSQLHLLDWYRIGFRLNDGPVDWRLNERSGQKSLLPSAQSGRKTYLFQVLSSDSKKSWNRESWKRLFVEIRRTDPFAELKMVCAPSEASQLSGLSKESGVELIPCGLDQAHDLIRRSDVFVTLDTSTKHLANDSPARIVELCFGSADFAKQGVYKRDSLILTPKAHCYPCGHSDRCPLVQRDCATEISVNDVLWAMGIRSRVARSELKCQVFETTTESEWSISPIEISKGENQIEAQKRIAEEHPEA